MRTKINDIRIRTSHKEEEKEIPLSTLCEVMSEDSCSIVSQTNFEELMNLSRRNFLKIMFASGGVLLAGSFLNKLNKFQNIPLVGQSSPNMGSVAMPMMDAQNLNNDYESFFNNFRIVKNQKEYILYNKQGDNILTIDRDA